MREQANLAISMANVIVFVTDIRQGVTAADREIALMLKNLENQLYLFAIKQIILKKIEKKYTSFII